MNTVLESEDIKFIANLFGQDPEVSDNNYSWVIKDPVSSNSIHFSIYKNIIISGESAVLVSVQTNHGYYELHGIKKWSFFPPDEIFFFAEHDNNISSLSISRNKGVSFFANVDKSIMEHDIAELDPALVLSTIQMSLFK